MSAAHERASSLPGPPGRIDCASCAAFKSLVALTVDVARSATGWVPFVGRRFRRFRQLDLPQGTRLGLYATTLSCAWRIDHIVLSGSAKKDLFDVPGRVGRRTALVGLVQEYAVR